MGYPSGSSVVIVVVIVPVIDAVIVAAIAAAIAARPTARSLAISYEYTRQVISGNEWAAHRDTARTTSGPAKSETRRGTRR